MAAADDRRGHLEHLPHPGAAGRALVADHDHVAGVDPAGLDDGEAVLLALEDAGRAGLAHALGAGDLDDGALGGEVAVQDREPALRLDRVGDGTDDVLAGCLVGRVGLLADRPAGDRDLVAVQQPGLGEAAEDQRHAAGAVEVGGDVAAAGLQVGEQRRLPGDPLEVGHLERDPGLAGDGEQVEDAVGRAAGGADAGDRVLERLAW